MLRSSSILLKLHSMPSVHKESKIHSLTNVQWIPHMKPGTRYKDEEHVMMLTADRWKIEAIAFYVFLQCVGVFTGGMSILYCFWSPDKTSIEIIKLVFVVYLYDYEMCGTHQSVTKKFQNLLLHNQSTDDSAGSHVKPIKFAPYALISGARPSSVTRKYILISIVLHVIWTLTAIAPWTAAQIKRFNFKYLKFIIGFFMYFCILMLIFDVSMAIVYIAHIQQSVTKNMILRHSGWSLELEITNPEEFAGWIAIAATACWLRGVLIFITNIFFVRSIWLIRKKIKKKEVIVKVSRDKNRPIPNTQRPILDTGRHALVLHAE